MDLTAEEEGLKVILPDARVVSVGQNILLNNRGEEDIALYGRDSEEAFFILKPGSSFYIYLTNNTTIPGIWSVIPFGQGAVVVTSVGAESDDPEALGSRGVLSPGQDVFCLNCPTRYAPFLSLPKKALPLSHPKDGKDARLWQGKISQ